MTKRALKAKKIKPAATPSLATAEILRQLNSAKTAEETRRAFTIIKLLAPAKAAAVSKYKTWSKTGKKILSHPLPPKTSVAAAVLVIAFAVTGLASAYGQWAQKLSAWTPQPPVANQVNLSFNPGQIFGTSVLAFQKNINSQLAIIKYQQLAMAPQALEPDINIRYYHSPALRPTAALASPTSNNLTLTTEAPEYFSPVIENYRSEPITLKITPDFKGVYNDWLNNLKLVLAGQTQRLELTLTTSKSQWADFALFYQTGLKQILQIQKQGLADQARQQSELALFIKSSLNQNIQQLAMGILQISNGPEISALPAFAVKPPAGLSGCAGCSANNQSVAIAAPIVEQVLGAHTVRKPTAIYRHGNMQSNK